jgi:hypothetical protein
MGIRFFCQHCEARLNVKSSQAGEAGVCPECGGTVGIPKESLLPGTPSTPDQRFYVEEEDDDEGSSQMLDFDEQDTMDGEIAGANETVEPIVQPPAQMTPVFATTGKSSSGIFMLDRPSPPPDFGKVDPIKSAPKKVWYFRSKLIGERGPLKPKVMQRHVDNGDVTVGCMVWREDWDDWVTAESAFPHLAGQASALDSIQPDESLGDLATATNSNPRLFEKQAVFYAVIIAGLAVVIALAYVVLKILPS